MAPPAFNFVTANFDCEERRILGTVGTGPQVYLKMGGALFRAIYTYRSTGIVMGALGSSLPTLGLSPMNAASEWCVMQTTSPSLYPDAADGYDYFDDTHDDESLFIVGTDPTFSGGRPAAPEIEEWCTQLGGTYTGL